MNAASGPSSSEHSSSSDFAGAHRRIPRYPVAVPVEVTVLRSGLPSNVPGRSVDIGEGGVAAVLAAELQTGEWVAVELQLPNVPYSLQTKAVVRHHSQLRCGFEFLGLSRDQRYMIRHWAGNQREKPSLESPVISSPLAKLPAPTVSATWPAPMPHLPAQARKPAPLSATARRLLWLTLALLVVVSAVSAWQWHRGWQQLEAQMARKDAHTRPPAARVAPEVMERLLVRKVDPVYPESARRANVQGIVVLGAIIAADGTVVNLHPLSGPEGLTSAAMDAVRWWRFRPYRVQGEPVAVEISLAIEFRP
jgi:TonB family protein